MTIFLLPLVRAGGGLIRDEASGARATVARRLGGGLIICCAALPAAGGAVWGVPGSRVPMRWREGVQSRVLGSAAGGSSAKGSCSPEVSRPAQACRKGHPRKQGGQ